MTGRGLTPPPPPHNPSDPGCVEHDPDGLYRREIKCKVCYVPAATSAPPTTQVAGRVQSPREDSAMTDEQVPPSLDEEASAFLRDVAAACCVDDDGPFELDEDGYCIGCGVRREWPCLSRSNGTCRHDSCNPARRGK